MLELGKKQSLLIVKELDFGVYLGETLNASMDDRVLLPKKQVPQGSRTGDTIEVFLYKDSKDRIIATTNRPLLSVGEVGKLRVSQVTKIGAFLDWGLEKDVLLPYKEHGWGGAVMALIVMMAGIVFCTRATAKKDY